MTQKAEKPLIKENFNITLWICVNLMRCLGFWRPKVSFHMILLSDLYMSWGDLNRMTSNALLTCTYIVQAIKLINILYRKDDIDDVISNIKASIISHATSKEAKHLVQRCNRVTFLHLSIFMSLTTVTLSGWAGSVEKRTFPVQARYPYDSKKSPAYEITYFHQVSAIFLAAYINVSEDIIIVTLMAITRCRLQLLKLELRDVTKGLNNSDDLKLFDENDQRLATMRLKKCIVEHNNALNIAYRIEKYFCYPTLVQLAVSLIIICTTEFQIAKVGGNLIRLASNGTYLLNMMFQVLIYCYHGDQLREESLALHLAAYECYWYKCSNDFRTTLRFVIMRCLKPIKITAGKFTALSLQTFVSVIRASYSLFTLLQQVNEETVQ